ncbi:MAG: hypothetical protein ACI4XA_04770 [Oscillospiraceae bacterium]
MKRAEHFLPAYPNTPQRAQYPHANAAICDFLSRINSASSHLKSVIDGVIIAYPRGFVKRVDRFSRAGKIFSERYLTKAAHSDIIICVIKISCSAFGELPKW